tara:strand:+ start:103 stop:1179 length:1077 start_codon:yes stop_codon:yes gene_type:complete
MDTVKEIIGFINKVGYERILLVTGKNSFVSTGLSKKFEEMDCFNSFVQFNDFSENPKIKDLKKGIKIFNENKCEAVIAVGGGSALDMGKLIAYFNKIEENDINALIEFSKNNVRKTPLACIPTTAGSGAEATHFAVLYSDGVKYSISNPSLCPDKIILDHSLSMKCSSKQKAISGLDALSQGIESFWSKNATKESKDFAIKSIKLIWNNLADSVINNSWDAHKKVFEGSHLAGKAINISKTTAPHAISYFFTQKHNIKHGHAVFLTMGRIYCLNRCNALKSKDSKYGKIFIILDDILGIENKPEEAFKNFLNEIKVEIDLKKLGIDIKKEINQLKLEVNEERFKNNPFALNINEIFNI